MNTPDTLQPLARALLALTPPPEHPALLQLVENLRARYDGCAKAILFYGSCLRGGDPYDGLVDLYLVVDRYRCANTGIIRSLWNWLLPPNVFYAEFPYEGKVVRCKYAILTQDDFLKGTSPRWFQSYLWGRFSQPTSVAWASDPAARQLVATGMAQAVVTLLDCSLPSLPASGSVESLWEETLKLSYATELRPESRTRSKELTSTNADYYRSVTKLAAPLLQQRLTIEPDNHYTTRIGRLRRTGNRIAWRTRSIQGKFLSLARLTKALFTFQGGLDYVAWKLERHSGEHIEIPDNVRRYPLIFVWGMVWHLYRRGIFR